MNIKLKGKQQEILNLPVKGHNVVSGVAGSGKSICSIFRAKFIEKLDEGNVIVLTYNGALVNYLQTASRDLLTKVEIKTYHQFATAYMRSQGLLKGNQIVDTDKLKESFIDSAIENVSKRITSDPILHRKEFIMEEIKWLQRMGVETSDQYENMVRIGRGKGTGRFERSTVFQVYSEYLKLRSLQGFKYDWDDISYYFYKDIMNNKFTPKYNHIIIDEGQDFSPTMIKSIAAYVKDKGSVLLLGDQAQQIYGSKMSWKQAGLNIRKQYKLDENYRNTIEIENLAKELRKVMDLDEDDITHNTRNLNKGSLPELIQFSKDSNEKNYITARSRELLQEGNVAIIVKTNREVISLCSTLGKANVPYSQIKRETTILKDEEKVYVGTYHSVKGLEFDSVIIPYCTENKLINQKKAIALDSVEEIEAEIAKLIYVAVTRARKNLVITATDEVVSILPQDPKLIKVVEMD